jgi:UDP-2-acetamido-2-deoxy-ribo-hexuluronate aminotransferase
MEFIDLKAQYQRYKAEIDARMAKVLAHGAFIMGPEIAELERALAAYVGSKHCISMASGTTALEIVLRAMGIGPGDEVITVPFTWISTAEVIGLVGARPVFVDIEPDYYNIDVEKIAGAISPRTKAIIPVNLFGQLPDYDRINAVAEQHNVVVIEDAAQSFGAQQGGRRSCHVSRVACTSFFPAKPLGCYGDGGAVFTSDDALAEKIKAIRTHGGIERHYHPLLGTNGRFDTLQAAVLLAKLPHFDDELQRRTRIGARYSQLLAGSCQTPAIARGNTHVYAQYTVRLPQRDANAAQLKKQGIPSAVYYPKCLHEQPVFAKCGFGLEDFPESMRASREVLSLPMHPFLSEEQQDQVVRGVKAALAPSTR